MTPVKPQISNLRPRSLAKGALTCYGGCTHEGFLSVSSHSYMVAYYLSAFVLVATLLSTFRPDQPHFAFSPNSPWAVSPYKTLHTNEMLTCANDLTRLAKAHEYSRHNTLRPPLQDFSALNFDICGFTGVITVILNTNFKLLSFLH